MLLSDRHKKTQTKAAIRAKNFFPEGCVFHWNGKGKVRQCTLALSQRFGSGKEVCPFCEWDRCGVRQAQKKVYPRNPPSYFRKQ